MSVEIKNKFVKKANEIARWSEVFNKELTQKFDELDQIRFEYRTTYEKVRKRLGNQVTFDQRYGVMKRVLCEEARFKVSADILLDFNDLIEEVLSGAGNNNNSDAESLASSENQQTEVEYDQSRLKELFQTEACNNKGADCNDGYTQSPISLSSDSQEKVKKYASSLSKSDSSGQENVEPISDRFADKNNNKIQRKFDISDLFGDQENSQKKTESNGAPDKDKNGIKRRCDLFAESEKNQEKADLESKENTKNPVHFVYKIPKIIDKRESLTDIEKPQSSSHSQPVVRLSIECLNNNKTSDKSLQSLTQKSNPEKTIPTFKQSKE